MDERPRRSLEIDAVPLGRRRSFLAPLAVAVASAAFVLVAVVKPWAADEPAGSHAATLAASPVAAQATDGGPTRAAASRSPLATPFPDPPTDEELLAAASRRAAWGVRAVVVPPGSTPAGNGTGAGLEERWTAIDEPGSARDRDRTVGVRAAIAGDGDAVLAIGVSTAADALPLDVRVWRLDGSGVPSRVMPRPLPGPDPGSWLWRPDPAEASAIGAWPAGTYRFDLLLGQRIERVVMVVPGDVLPVTRGDPVAALPADLGARLGPRTNGLFIVAGGRAIEVDAEVLRYDAASLDEHDAWLLPGLDRPLAAVGRVRATDVAGIGIRLIGAVSPGLSLQLLSPVEATVVAPVEAIPLSRATAVVIHADGGRPFGAGTYRLWATWTTPGGEARSEIRLLEIVPSTPTLPPGSPLDALRRWTGRAAIPGATIGEPLITAADLRPSSDRGTCGDGALVTGSTPLLGLALPPGEDVTDIRLVAPDGYTQIETRAMLPGPDGLALLALPSGGLIPARYRIDVTRVVPGGARSPVAETRGTTYDVCIR